jgi:hypothetical protein
VSPHPELRFVCDLCGAPRIEVKGKPVSLTGREKRSLEEARKAQRQRAGWRVAGVFAGITGSFLFAVFALIGLIFSAGFGWALTGAFALGPLLLLLVLAITRSKGKTQEIQKALDRAWTSAARDVVLSEKGGIALPDLAARLGLAEAHAERIAAELSVDNQIASRVSDDGRLILEGTTGVRIDPGSTPEVPADPLEARFAELERQQAEEEAEEQRKKQTRQ